MRLPPIQLTPEQIAVVNKHQAVVESTAAVNFKEIGIPKTSAKIRYSVVRLTPQTAKLVVHIEPLALRDQEKISRALYAMCATDLKHAGILAETTQDEDQPSRLVFMILDLSLLSADVVAQVTVDTIIAAMSA